MPVGHRYDAAGVSFSPPNRAGRGLLEDGTEPSPSITSYPAAGSAHCRAAKSRRGVPPLPSGSRLAPAQPPRGAAAWRLARSPEIAEGCLGVNLTWYQRHDASVAPSAELDGDGCQLALRAHEEPELRPEQRDDDRQDRLHHPHVGAEPGQGLGLTAQFLRETLRQPFRLLTRETPTLQRSGQPSVSVTMTMSVPCPSRPIPTRLRPLGSLPTPFGSVGAGWGGWIRTTGWRIQSPRPPPSPCSWTFACVHESQ
jgi:hypothetical protein